MNNPASPVRKRHRLAIFLTAGIVAMVALITLSLLILIDHFAFAYAGKEAQLRLQQLSWQMRDTLNIGMRNAGTNVTMLAELPAIRDAQSPTETRKILESLQRTTPDYAWIGLADANGKVFAATGALLENTDVSARPWFQSGIKGPVAEDYHPAKLLGQLLPQNSDPWRFVDVAAPVYRMDGTKRGVLAVHMSWDWARRQARELLVPALRSYGAEIFVVRDDGVVILGPQGFEEKKISTTSLTLARKEGTDAIEEVWDDGRNYFVGYAQTGFANDPMSLRWSVLVRQPKDIAMAATHALELRLLGLSVLLGTVFAILATLLTRRLMQPVNRLSQMLEQRASESRNGKTAHDIPEIDSFHEIQVLSRAIRELVNSEEKYLQTLQTMNEQLESTVAERTLELRKLAMSDALTGLPNRRALMATLPEAAQRSARLRQPCAVLFMDLDGFKGVNDTYGHDEGDELLRQFAARITGTVRKTDTVARLAGDEFVVVLEMLADAEMAKNTANKLIKHLQEPYKLTTTTVTLGASIGVAIHFPDHPIDAEALLARADSAMYKAKHSGKNQVVVQEEIDVET